MKTESRYLLSENPINCYPTLALALGSDKAMIVQQVRYWMAHNAKDATKRSTHFIDDRWWTYNTFEQWEETFIWLSLRTIKSMFACLKRDGILLHGFFHHDPRNRTSWYSIDFDRLDEVVEAAMQKRYQKKVEKPDNTSLCNSCTLQSDEAAQCEGLNLHDVLYTETTNKDYSTETNSKVSHSKRFIENAERESEFEFEDASREANATMERTSPNPKGSEPNHQVTSGVTDPKGKIGSAAQVSTQKQKPEKYSDGGEKRRSRKLSYDDEGWLLLPNAAKFKMARTIAVRRMQYLLAMGVCEYASPAFKENGRNIHTHNGELVFFDREDEPRTESDLFDKSDSYSLRALRNYAVSLEELNPEWFNDKLLELFENSVTWCKENPDKVKKILNGQSILIDFVVKDFDEEGFRVPGLQYQEAS